MTHDEFVGFKDAVFEYLSENISFETHFGSSKYPKKDTTATPLQPKKIIKQNFERLPNFNFKI